MQLYFIRHAQSENNALWDRTGSSLGRSTDPALTEVGQRQAAILAQFLRQADGPFVLNGRDPQNIAGFGLTHLYTSLMTRAAATGAVVAEALNLPLLAWEDLHEGGGIYIDDEATGDKIGLPGPGRAYFAANFPRLRLPDELGEAGWWNRPFEERPERQQRARRALQSLLDRHGQADDRVAWISHGGFFNYFLEAVFNLPQRDGYWFVMNNVAITRLDFTIEGIDLVYLNRVEFLPREMVT
jgi:2,3-bisphosphoglycerate-dependent phosphoglycerate mutase